VGLGEGRYGTWGDMVGDTKAWSALGGAPDRGCWVAVAATCGSEEARGCAPAGGHRSGTGALVILRTMKKVAGQGGWRRGDDDGLDGPIR